jgi:hypothetical protein
MNDLHNYITYLEEETLTGLAANAPVYLAAERGQVDRAPFRAALAEYLATKMDEISDPENWSIDADGDRAGCHEIPDFELTYRGVTLSVGLVAFRVNDDYQLTLSIADNLVPGIPGDAMALESWAAYFADDPDAREYPADEDYFFGPPSAQVAPGYELAPLPDEQA